VLLNAGLRPNKCLILLNTIGLNSTRICPLWRSFDPLLAHPFIHPASNDEGTIYFTSRMMCVEFPIAGKIRRATSIVNVYWHRLH
jgi:hypothetical protein